MKKLILWHSFIHPITSYFRKKRGRYLKQQYPFIEKYRICDVGGSSHFWEKTGLNIDTEKITIYNVSLSETNPVKKDNKIKTIIYDGKNIPELSKSYDLVICNSVIEHVPKEQRQKLIEELYRVGERVFVQTPAYEFFLEPHFIMPFIHWLPRKIGRLFVKLSPWRILTLATNVKAEKYFWEIELLAYSDMRKLFSTGEICREKFLGFTKSYLVSCKRKI
ncbi:MAG: methyltransferase domain-containing protein [Candidatus Electrothrix communis]|nr:MAG: methyltransferase domain-containing protein [Candidatus Electrothrix communis]